MESLKPFFKLSLKLKCPLLNRVPVKGHEAVLQEGGDGPRQRPLLGAQAPVDVRVPPPEELERAGDVVEDGLRTLHPVRPDLEVQGRVLRAGRMCGVPKDT